MSGRICGCGKPAKNEVAILVGIVPKVSQMACPRHTETVRERLAESAAEGQDIKVSKI